MKLRNFVLGYSFFPISHSPPPAPRLLRNLGPICGLLLLKSTPSPLLHNKLSQLSMSKSTRRWITDFLADRKQIMRLSKLLSKPSALEHHKAVCSLLHSIPKAAPLALLHSHH